MEKDKRRHERRTITQVLELATSDGEVIKAQGVNISECGLLCHAEANIPPGTYIMFQLSIPGGKSAMTVGCEGTVLKCNENKTRSDKKYDLVVDFTDEFCG